MTGHFNPIAELFERGNEEPPTKDERYIRVRVKLLRRQKAAILVALDGYPDHQGWIPRSLIHGADESELDSKPIGATLALRIFDWKARQMGFAP